MAAIVLLVSGLGVFQSCEQAIDVDLPAAETKLVVEGRIEPGVPPIIILTKSSGYFDPVDLQSFEDSFIEDAEVEISTPNKSVELVRWCSNDIPLFLAPIAADLIGVSITDFNAVDYCIYSLPLDNLFSADPFLGEVGESYDLRIRYEGQLYTSNTTIPQPIALDSLWWEGVNNDTIEGVVWATLSDPDSLGHAYRWEARRTNRDEPFIAPFNSVFKDDFINGKTFDFAYVHGDDPADDEGQQFFDYGDTVIVKFSTIDRRVYRFLNSFEDNVVNSDNPFASPSSVPSNISGNALGVWAGYGVTLDTVVSVP